MNWRNVSSLHDWAWDPTPGQNWATDAAFRSGSPPPTPPTAALSNLEPEGILLGAGYYWYVSMGGDTVAVAKGPSPHGPWSDPLGKPFLSRDLGKSLR